MTELPFQSATDLVHAIKTRKLKSADLLELYIGRMQAHDSKINAIVATDVDHARARAHDADKSLERGQHWGVLHGLPMTIKDSYEVMGMPCTSGSPDLKDYRPDRNAYVVQRLLDQGAIIFGKTNLPLFAMDLQSYNEVYGQTNNPWNPDLVPGGSSGGAAAALAAGLTGLEIGSDIGGSIRNPAHFCGVFGHKSTFGIVPMRGHIPPPPGTFPGAYTTETDIAVAGPMARSAKDLGLVLDLITSPADPLNKAWHLDLPPVRKKDLKEFKIAVWLDDKAFPTDTKVLDCLQNAIDRLIKLGAQIEENRPAIDFAKSHQLYIQLLSAATSAGLPQDLFDGLMAKAKDIPATDHSDMARSIRGYSILHRDWLRADYVRTMMRENWAEFFKQYDILLCPPVSIAAFPHDHSEDFFARKLTVNGEIRSYFDTTVAWAGLTGMVLLPATVAPVGLTSDGLPVGIQIVAPYLEDHTSIHFAGLIEDSLGGFVPPPGYE